MEDSITNDDDLDMEHDSQSSGSFSKDSLRIGHHQINHRETLQHPSRREGNTRNVSADITGRSICSEVNSHRNSLATPKWSNKNRTPQVDMTQSLYERPWATSGRNVALSNAINKQREEKLRLAKEEQQRKHQQKMAELNESQKIAQRARLRKEVENQRKIDEKKQKAIERKRIVDERKERLNKEEEMRRMTLLKKLVGKTSKPQSSNNTMTMSCYGDFSSAKSRPGNKEVVLNRLNNKWPSSANGKTIAFGSTTPRPFCINSDKSTHENIKMREEILAKCEILSRPASSRISEKMTNSIIKHKTSSDRPISSLQHSHSKEVNRYDRNHGSLTMTTSMIDFPTKSKLNERSHPTVPLKPKQKMPVRDTDGQSTKYSHMKVREASETRSPSVSLKESNKNNSSSSIKKTTQPRSVKTTKSQTTPKVDTHLDSDSLEEEAPNKSISNEFRNPKSCGDNLKENTQVTETLNMTIHDESKQENRGGRALSTKDLSEAEYKTRLMENRRLSREKREKEREHLMKAETEKKHNREIATREMIGVIKENKNSLDHPNSTTANDDTIDEPQEIYEENEEESFSKIFETSLITTDELPPPTNKEEKEKDEKNERKRKLDLIMSRIRKPNEESSSDGGMSPKKVMSPEPAEFEPEISASTFRSEFQSSLLQSMMNNGRFVRAPYKDSCVGQLINERNENNTISPNAVILSAVRESIEDMVPPLANVNFSSVSDVLPSDSEKKNFSVVSSIDREDCNGKEDSLSLNDIKMNSADMIVSESQHSNGEMNRSLKLSTETEEEEIIKNSFEERRRQGIESFIIGQ